MKSNNKLKSLSFTRYSAINIVDFNELLIAIKKHYGKATCIEGFYDEVYKHQYTVVLSNPIWPDAMAGERLPEMKVSWIKDKDGGHSFEFND